MRLAPDVVSGQARLVADLLSDGRLELTSGENVVASIEFAPSSANVTDGRLVITGFRSTVATGTGYVDAFRAVGGDGAVVLEGSAGLDGELRLVAGTPNGDVPASFVRSGDVVRVDTITYTQPAD